MSAGEQLAKESGQLVQGKDLFSVSVGDTVVRWLGNLIPLELVVSSIEDGYVHCGPWMFSQATGAEIDEGLDWGEHGTGSILRVPENKPKKGNAV